MWVQLFPQLADWLSRGNQYDLHARSTLAALPESNTIRAWTSKADLTDVSHRSQPNTTLNRNAPSLNILESIVDVCTVLFTSCKCKQSTHGPLAQAGLPALACLGSSASTSAAAHARRSMPSSVPDSAQLLDAHWTRDLHLVVPLAQQKLMRHYSLSYRKRHSWVRTRFAASIRHAALGTVSYDLFPTKDARAFTLLVALRRSQKQRHPRSPDAANECDKWFASARYKQREQGFATTRQPPDTPENLTLRSVSLCMCLEEKCIHCKVAEVS